MGFDHFSVHLLILAGISVTCVSCSKIQKDRLEIATLERLLLKYKMDPELIDLISSKMMKKNAANKALTSIICRAEDAQE